MDSQATIELGAVGHTSHGKTTLVADLTGVHTSKHRDEIARNLTIRLGYANAKLWQCPMCHGAPDSYVTTRSTVTLAAPPTCSRHSDWTPEPVPMRLVRHVSFVDCPGHEALMATMINGAASMDGAMLVIGAQDTCPMPQTANHLLALELMNLDPAAVLVCQNKIDLVDRVRAVASHHEITTFLASTKVAARAPVIPLSAQFKINLEVTRHWIHRRLPVPRRDIRATPRMLVVRSFDVNHPGTELEDLVGGIAGGTLQRGVLRVGDEIEIRPGIVVMHQQTASRPKGAAAGAPLALPTYECTPLRSRIVSLKSEQSSLAFVVPGGLIAVGTQLDPALTRGDRLVGQVIGLPFDMPGIYSDLQLEYDMLPSTVDAPPEPAPRASASKKRHAPAAPSPPKFAKNELIVLYIGTKDIKATVTSCYVSRKTQAAVVIVRLHYPACTDLQQRISIARRRENRWCLSAVATVVDGNAVQFSAPR